VETEDVLPNINCTQTTETPKNVIFLFLVTLTFDLDLQTHPSEGPNTSSVWIWHKSFQWFRRYFVDKQKTTDWRCQKQNLCSSLLFTAC